jgi:hypothetical protein
VRSDTALAKFDGLEADQHRLPAIEAGEALTGLGRSLVIISNYLVEGRVRVRAPYIELSHVYLSPLRTGSVDAVFNISFNTEAIAQAGVWVGMAVTSGLIGNAAYDLIKSTFRRGVGQPSEIQDPNLKAFVENRTGDLDALVDAIEPALKQAHRPISIGALTININHGQNQIVQLDPNTKRYVETNVKVPDSEVIQVSTASYNANSRYGRVFDYSLGRTVSFTIVRDADEETLTVVVSSLQEYAISRSGKFNATVKKTKAIDGRDRHYSLLVARW